ncbi:uncharacterized protein BO87DRAFT_400618 [Aspergillus neoniger CBS 115656]|uniref:Saposin B-type domain-containing protein n=1 Tax=Aspergillus neoniger (strain CBS 115656) TaxID=1448310 RepID=A0A318YBT7_ASPNB|nr:hypothetical protein BO87DRAFT_400618 [Aspergillus neoniger CBS 115656]PYH30150.1 hypothetical protein BO87DRAFT_400618 [Aspergillus neoniger CBS 115656]
MRVRLIPVALVAVGIFILTWAALSKSWTGSGENVAFCADCLGYVRDVDTMFQKNTGAWANSQFFRYALDKSCRGRILITGRCLQYRRRLLEKPAISMSQLDSPYEAFSTSQGRRSGIQRRQNLEIRYTLLRMLSKIRNAASLKGGDPINSEICDDDQIYGHIFEPHGVGLVPQSERKPCFMSLPRAGLDFIIFLITTSIAYSSMQMEEALLILCGRQVTLQEIEGARANVSRYMVYPQSYAGQQTGR